MSMNNQKIAWPAARVAGDLIFVGTHTPHDPDNGRLVTSTGDMPDSIASQIGAPVLFTEIVAGKCRAQTRTVLERLRQSVVAAGGSIERMAHLRIFLTDLAFEGTVLAEVTEFFGSNLPSGEIVMASNDGSNPDMLVHMDAIGVSASGRDPEHVRLDGMEALTHPFPTATRAGGFLFTSQVPGCDWRTGGLPEHAGQLSERGRTLLGALAGRSSRAHLRFFLQQAAMWDNLLSVLDCVGIGHKATLYHMNWMRQPMKVFADGSVTRSIMEHTGDYLLTCFPVSGLRTTGAELEGRLIAILPESGMEKDIRVPIHGVSNSYFGMIKAGPYLFTSGEVPIDTVTWQLRRELAELDPPYRNLNFGKPYREQPILGQSHYIYSLYEETLASYGADLSHAVHQTAYMADAGDGPALEGVIASRFRLNPPPTTIVPILGASPFEATRLELEMTAYVGD